MIAKKGQGMSINTIIIAIIVLVVLVVLIMIFTGYFSGWTKNVGSCGSQGGACMVDRNTCTSSNGRVIPATCAVKEDVCCIAGSIATNDDTIKPDCVLDALGTCVAKAADCVAPGKVRSEFGCATAGSVCCRT